MGNFIFKTTLFILLIFLFIACEDEYIPDTVDAEQVYIVEGYVISSDQEVAPPYVILTKSIPFFSSIDANTLSNIFVRNADIRIHDGEKNVKLTEICLDQLTPEQREMFSSSFGLDSVSNDFNYCVYVDITQSLDVKEGGAYTLKINVENTELTATTTIPKYIGLDSVWTEATPGIPLDSFNQLLCKIEDPKGESNFYQYKNGYVGEGLVSPFVSSIADFLFDGKTFKFPMDRAVRDFMDEDTDTFQYFRKEDSIQVEWICIDQAQYEFWNTLELDRVQQGPFSSYIRTKTNINGGIGVFSGRSSKIYKIAN